MQEGTEGSGGFVELEHLISGLDDVFSDLAKTRSITGAGRDSGILADRVDDAGVEPEAARGDDQQQPDV